MKRYSIGDVGFATKHPADCGVDKCVQYEKGRSEHLHRLDLFGKPRVEMLQLAFDQKPLPKDVVMVGGWSNPITWAEVRWDTSGLRGASTWEGQ